MPTQQESPAAAPAAVSGTSQKLLQLLRKRLRQLARVTLVLAICLALAATALAIWWLTSLNGLSDIGDPFDVAAYRAFSVPEDQNAFTFVSRANQKLTPFLFTPDGAWARADPTKRAWVEANREALELFLHGAEQSDAVHPAGDLSARHLMGLTFLEGSKRQESGDIAGAWECYRAVLRMTTHIRRRGNLHQRKDLNRGMGWLQQQQRLAAWATDTRTTIPQLHGALEEVLKNKPRAEWDAHAIKCAYLDMLSSLERPIQPFVQEEVGWEYIYRLGDMQLSEGMVGYVEAAHRFLLREPERSRRVLRLLCANWLAHVENPEPLQRKPAVLVSFPLRVSTNPIRTVTTTVPLYPVTTTGTGSLPPQELASWLVTTNDAKLRILVTNSYLPWSPANHLRDRKAHRELVIMLATEIHHRERGSLPPSEEALVGTYLKSLPDDGSTDLAEEMAPIVE
jgi:hypothetical protein